jgi:hypothetical protein
MTIIGDSMIDIRALKYGSVPSSVSVIRTIQRTICLDPLMLGRSFYHVKRDLNSLAKNMAKASALHLEGGMQF